MSTLTQMVNAHTHTPQRAIFTNTELALSSLSPCFLAIKSTSHFQFPQHQSDAWSAQGGANQYTVNLTATVTALTQFPVLVQLGHSFLS